MVAHVPISTVLWWGAWGQSQGDHWGSLLTSFALGAVGKRLCLKEIRQRMTEKDTRHSPMASGYAQVYVPAHTREHISHLHNAQAH